MFAGVQSRTTDRGAVIPGVPQVSLLRPGIRNYSPLLELVPLEAAGAALLDALDPEEDDEESDDAAAGELLPASFAPPLLLSGLPSGPPSDLPSDLPSALLSGAAFAPDFA